MWGLGFKDFKARSLAFWIRLYGLSWVLPPLSNSLYILGVLLRAIYNPIIIIIQLFLRGGGNAQGLRFRVYQQRF